MSYGLRNTIILLVTLSILGGGAFSYIKFVQEKEINRLSAKIAADRTNLAQKQQISRDYPLVAENLEKAKDILASFDKSLYPKNNSDNIYFYLNQVVGDDLDLFYNFSFSDSVSQAEYGFINTAVNGGGKYTDFITFINRLENSELLNKVNRVTVAPGLDDEGNSVISFSINLQSYYQKRSDEFTVELGNTEIKQNPDVSIFNVFQPLILESLPQNLDNLVNVESSRILGITGTRVFLIDQEGVRRTLQIGDKVYLGYLESISTINREVVFNLDMGGIKELITLKIER